MVLGSVPVPNHGSIPDPGSAPLPGTSGGQRSRSSIVLIKRDDQTKCSGGMANRGIGVHRSGTNGWQRFRKESIRDVRYSGTGKI